MVPIHITITLASVGARYAGRGPAAASHALFQGPPRGARDACEFSVPDRLFRLFGLCGCARGRPGGRGRADARPLPPNPIFETGRQSAGTSGKNG